MNTPQGFGKRWAFTQYKFFFLQPTRIVSCKRIELAINLYRRLNTDSILVITHASGDEEITYEQYLHDNAEILNVDLIFG
jgi:hypothetical protein